MAPAPERRLSGMETPSTRLLTVVGGPLDGEVVELPEGATEYVAARDGGRGFDTYRAEEWTHRDAEGRMLWTRVCLVWVEGQE